MAERDRITERTDAECSKCTLRTPNYLNFGYDNYWLKQYKTRVGNWLTVETLVSIPFASYLHPNSFLEKQN